MRFKARALMLSVLASCGRPDSLVLCHNANCAGTIRPDRDDTMDALEESLALSYRGRPALDGIELDVFWDAGGSRCLFAHDIQSATGISAMRAAERIAEHLASTPPPVSWNGEHFVVKLELKGQVGESLGDRHTAAQARAHADCALDLSSVLERGASDGGHPLVVIFDSSSPRVLRELVRRPRWPGEREGPGPTRWRVSADFPDNTRSGLGNERLSEFTDGVHLDVVEFHAGAVTDGAVQAFRSLGVDFTVWMFSATAENLDAIDQLEPRYVLTYEALFMRRWLEY